MSSCKLMTEKSSPMMRAGGPSTSGSCTSCMASGRGELAVAPMPATTRGEDDEWLWESDWVSEWESDWESGGEKDPFIRRPRRRVTVRVMEDDDSEPKVKKLKSMKSLAVGDDRVSPTEDHEMRGDRTALCDEGVIELDGDSSGTDSDEDGTDFKDIDDDGTDFEEAPGVACHYCKERKAEKKVHCSRCPIRICGSCLQNRNGEKLAVETQQGVKWVCPKCRAGCGPGCTTCCICPPCRKRKGLPPTGHLIRLARQIGFDNVHDYLIHLQTKEPPEKIAQRKDGRCWTKSGGAMGYRSVGETGGMSIEPAQFWADCAPANWATAQSDRRKRRKKIAKGKKKKAGGAISCPTAGATVGLLKPAQFWTDCAPDNRATIAVDNQKNLQKIAKRLEAGGCRKSGGASSFSTGGRVGMLQPAQFWADCAPASQGTLFSGNRTIPKETAKGDEVRGRAKAGGAVSSFSNGATVGMVNRSHFQADCAPAISPNRATLEFKNQQTYQRKGQLWTLPKAMDVMGKSVNSNAKPSNEERESAILPSGDVEKLPANAFETSKCDNVSSRHVKRTGSEQVKLLDQILGRNSEKAVRLVLSLDVILNRLLYPEDRFCQDGPKPPIGSVQQIRRNRKHRKMGRILDPSMFQSRKSKDHNATEIRTAASGFSPTTNAEVQTKVQTKNVQLESHLRVGELMPENYLSVQPKRQNSHGSHHTDRSSLEAPPLPLKKPITSLQALRKMGLLPQRNSAGSSVIEPAFSQKPCLATAPPLVDHSPNQRFGVVSPSATVPASGSSSQATPMLHLQRRNKIDFRSCSKSENTILSVPSKNDCKLVTETRAAWGGKPVIPGRHQPQSAVGNFSQMRCTNTGFELSTAHRGVQRGFESFSHKETVIGFGSFRGGDAGLSTLKT